ncbi:MAG: sigma-70 family RNA polymerase sigma factor, partial [Actinomycetota bacterium]
MSRSLVARVFADEWPAVVAALVRDLGDLDLAEDAAQDAFVEAAARWGPDDTPDRPGAWLVTTARRKAIDRLRRDRRFADRLPQLHQVVSQEPPTPSDLVDDQLAVVFGCCHPALADEARVALTLREVAGLSTAQIARSFLVSEATMAKRLVRAKQKIRTANIPLVIPDRDAMDDRLAAVLHVVYLIFTEGHASGEPATLVRGDLCDEARWLAGLLVRLLPDEPEVLGLASLLAFVDARRAARVDADGALVLLEDQDRTRWDADAIEEGERLLEEAAGHGRIGRYQLQAVIARAHSTAPDYDETDWRAVVGAYDLMAAVDTGPVVALNRAVAVAMADGPEAGLALIDDLVGDGPLDGFHYAHAARADLLRRLDRREEAVSAYGRALDLVTNGAERAFLERRL